MTIRPAVRSHATVRVAATVAAQACAHVDGRIVAGVVAALDAEPLQVRKPAVRNEVIVRLLAASQPRKVLPQRVVMLPRVCHGSAQKDFSVTTLITLAAAIRDHDASDLIHDADKCCRSRLVRSWLTEPSVIVGRAPVQRVPDEREGALLRPVGYPQLLRPVGPRRHRIVRLRLGRRSHEPKCLFAATSVKDHGNNHGRC